MVPIELQNHLSTIGAQFGGFDTIAELLPASDIYYLSTFPGSFFVVTPWTINLEGYKVDFSYAGHLAGRPYKVFNKEFIYLHSNTSLIFEGTEAEALLASAYHGEYFHIQLATKNGLELVILWVCKRVAPVVIDNTLRQLRNQIKPVVEQPHQLILDCRGLSLSIYIGYGNNLTVQDLIVNGQIVEVSDRIIRLTPTQSTWYGFKSEDIWYTVTLSGDQADRWRQIGELHYFKATNSYIPRVDTLTTRNFSLAKLGRANLYGRPKAIEYIRGQSYVICRVNYEPEFINLNFDFSIPYSSIMFKQYM